jgi:hypothetical protein
MGLTSELAMHPLRGIFRELLHRRILDKRDQWIHGNRFHALALLNSQPRR